ncbi:MAG: Na+/H+ antiporter NhaA [Rickettsiales bacterium]|nr:Na+/H+ antiporter NhaA [Rickettsiales bacterium]MCA0254579.1 Na+/H+ antiporter NhaA [Pseudomonadota bacterium]
MEINYKIKEFIKSETFAGILLILSFVIALIISNNTISYEYYKKLAYLPIKVSIGDLHLSTYLTAIVNDGVMTFFFLLVGLEMKYHLVEGEYRESKKLILPIFAAIGGLIVPALIYVFFNFNQPTLKGWAIPIASDTAFILGILSLFRKHISLELKVFIIGFSLIDDALALAVLAIFYTKTIYLTALYISAFLVFLLFMMNIAKIEQTFYYMLVGLLLWVAMVEAGIHGTLAGAVIALAIPVKLNNESNRHFSELEHLVRPVVNYYVLPIFIFLNSGISFKNFTINSTCSNISLGIILGLFLGKQLGIFLFSYPIVKAKICTLPSNTTWIKFYSIAILGGIGFTLSLFIGGLTFEEGCPANSMRVAVIIGSLLSAIFGIIVLKYSNYLQSLVEKK